jgi:hypothetical protein
MATLSDALRRAAIDRAHASGEVIDAFVLEPSGVIDLRRLEAESRDAAPRAALVLPTLGITEADLDIRDERPVPESRWRRSISRNVDKSPS